MPPCALLLCHAILSRLRASVGSQASKPHLEDHSIYHPLRPTRLDKITNFHSADSIDTESLSTRGRSVWVHSSQVRLLHSSVPNNGLLERVGPLGTDVYRDQQSH